MLSPLFDRSRTPTMRQRNTDVSFFPIRTSFSRSKTPTSKRLDTPGSVRQATLQLDFIVIGAGIGGLATAFALARSGHRVRVFDKLDGTSRQRSVGARIPPNLSKILYAWGLRDELSTATRCRKTGFHSMETNELVGILEWQEDVIKETGGDFLLMHYDDLYSMLYNLAVSAGVTITFNAEIVSVSVDRLSGAPRAVMTDGTTLAADLIVGADGSQSVAREAVTGQADCDDLPCDHCFFTIVVPVEKMRTDPDWSKWVGVQEWPIWMGPGRSLLVYPIKGGREYCVHAYLPHSDSKGVPESWTTYIPTSVIDLEGTHSSIKRLFSMVPEALLSKYIIRKPLDEWVDRSGTIILIGEAAHPLMPFTIHNASLAVEDAAVLGSLMSHLSSREQLPQILEAYQDLRLSRVKQVQENELNNAALVTQVDPQVRAMRDIALNQSLKVHSESLNKWTDEQLRAQWDEIGVAFGYDATDAAEDWWIKWGSLGELSRQEVVSRPLFDFCFHVTQTMEEVA